MENNSFEYESFYDGASVPPMFGLACSNGDRVYRVSTDGAEVDRLADACTRNHLSPEHMRDVVDDFRHG